MTSLIGGGETSSEEREVTWNGQERGRRGDEMTGLTGTGIVAERGGGTTIVVTENDSHPLDTSARSTNA